METKTYNPADVFVRIPGFLSLEERQEAAWRFDGWVGYILQGTGTDVEVKTYRQRYLSARLKIKGKTISVFFLSIDVFAGLSFKGFFRYVISQIDDEKNILFLNQVSDSRKALRL